MSTTTTLTTLLTTYLTPPLLLLALWLYTAHTSLTFPTLRSKRIALLIAHPDDEAMFFSPTVTRLTDPSLRNTFRILCLSTGTAGGLGEVRRGELYKSAALLGVSRKEDIVILDDPALQDGATWSPTQISSILTHYFAPSTPSRKPASNPPTTTIDVLLTFDGTGVSGHHNHKACHAGALEFLKTLSAGKREGKPPLEIYTLTSINVARKFSGAIDCLFTVLTATYVLARAGLSRKSKKSRSKEEEEPPLMLMCVSGLGDWVRGLRAMVQGHWSQMLWFRWGWIGVGRYMVVNDLRRVKV